MDQEREKVAMTVRCKLQLSFYSLKPDLNPVPDILAPKGMCALFANSKAYCKINPRCSSQECISVLRFWANEQLGPVVPNMHIVHTF